MSEEELDPPCPPLGSQPEAHAKQQNEDSKPTRTRGMETPRTATDMARLSSQESLRRAATMPSGMPVISASPMADERQLQGGRGVLRDNL